jgi:membrane-associated protein
VPSPTELAATLAEVATITGPWAPAILFFAAFVEHVFPPFPGDLLVVLGAWYAVQGELPWPVVLLLTTAGAVAGGWVDHRVGAALGRGLERRAGRSRLLPPERLAAFEAAYRRWGAWLILANRFLPGIRAFLFVAAGASGLPLPRVLALGALSAVLWNGMLLGAGVLLARNLEELLTLVQRSTATAGVLVVGALLVLALRALWLRRRGRA